MDFGGYTFTFYARQGGAADEFYIEEETGDMLGDAVYARNRDISEAYNINFALKTDAENGAGAAASLLAGDDDYDLVAPHARIAFQTYAAQGLALNWETDLPYVDLDNPWWTQDARESFKICDKLYVMTGDISYENLGASRMIIFNKRLFQELDIAYPYQLVTDGKWTFDIMAEYVKSSYRDLNGNGTYEFESDQSGYATTWWGSPISILFSAGQRICKKNENGELELCINDEKTVDVYDTFFDFLKNPGCYLLKQDDGSPVHNTFNDGRLLLMECTVNDLQAHRDMSDDFGIVPVPKFYEEMENYCTLVDAGVHLLVVPTTAGDPERTSVILEALAYESYKNTIHTYYDVVLGTKYARDEDSVKMLDIIRGTRVYDTDYFYGATPFGSVGWELCKMAEPNFSSFYAKNEKTALRGIKEINKKYQEEP